MNTEDPGARGSYLNLLFVQVEPGGQGETLLVLG